MAKRKASAVEYRKRGAGLSERGRHAAAVISRTIPQMILPRTLIPIEVYNQQRPTTYQENSVETFYQHASREVPTVYLIMAILADRARRHLSI